MVEDCLGIRVAKNYTFNWSVNCGEENTKEWPSGKGLDNWHRISIKVSQVQNTGGCWKQIISQLGVWVVCGRGQQERNWGRIQVISTLCRENRDSKTSRCSTNESNPCRRTIFSQEGEQMSIFNFPKWCDIVRWKFGFCCLLCHWLRSANEPLKKTEGANPPNFKGPLWLKIQWFPWIENHISKYFTVSKLFSHLTFFFNWTRWDINKQM